jgi:hypothetical protein
MGGPRHSVERGHGSLRRDVARAASSCARRHRRVGRPIRLAAPTPTITLRSSTPSTRRIHIVSIRAADGLVVLGGRGRPPDGKTAVRRGARRCPRARWTRPPPSAGPGANVRREAQARAARSRPRLAGTASTPPLPNDGRSAYGAYHGNQNQPSRRPGRRPGGVAMPDVLFSVDQTKSMADQAVPGHNRWHPDIQAAA